MGRSELGNPSWHPTRRLSLPPTEGLQKDLAEFWVTAAHADSESPSLPFSQLSSRISSPGRVLDLKQFGNHPQLSAMISEQDVGMLRFMMNLKVQEVTFPSACRRILLFFGKNSYFQNEVLVKEYVVSAAGYRASHSTPIQWSQHYEREAYRRQTHDNGLNFFNWFCGHHLAGSGRIAEVGPCDRLGQ
ncbi:testis-specific Y-encoded protein 10-like isoform 1-T5 [Lycaon pictus]